MNKKNILVINPFGIGDVLFTTPLLENIKDKYPNAKIGYLCNKRAVSVLKNNPFVDKLFLYERDDFENIKKVSYLNWLKAIWNFVQEIKNENFDIAIDCSMNTQYGLIAMLAGIKTRIGYDYKRRGKFLTKRIPFLGFDDKHVVDYYMDLLSKVGFDVEQTTYKIYLSEEEKLFAEEFYKKRNISLDSKLTVLSPGGGASWGRDAYRKQWPIEKWINLTELLLEDQQTAILVSVGPGEEELADKISAIAADRIISTKGLSVREYLAVLDRCKLAVCNDGGPLHMAAALGLKTVSVFGPVDESVYGPHPLDKNKHKVFVSKLKCRPCYKRFRLAQCDRDIQCLRDIDVETVKDAVVELINNKL